MCRVQILMMYTYRGKCTIALSVQRQTLQAVAWNSHGVTCFCCCRQNCNATCRGTLPCNLPSNNTALVTIRWWHFYCHSQRWNWHFSWPPWRTERWHPVYQRNRIKWKTSFSRLFGKLWQQRTANDSVQKTNAYQQITWWIILQPDFTQSHDSTIKTLTRRVQLVCDTPDSLCDENKCLEHVFHKNNTMLTLLVETFTDTYRRWRNEWEPDTCDYTLYWGHFWDHLTDPTALQHLCCPQTCNYVMTLTDRC